MEIKRLKHFRTIVEAGSLKEAAALLHLTPSALSKSLRQLEEDVGHSLFNRSRRKLSLSDSGRLLYNSSENLLDEHARVLRSLNLTPARHDKLLRIATFEVFSTHVLARTMRDIDASLRLRVLELPVREISAAVAEREVDVGISYAPYPAPNLEFEKIGTARFGIYGLRSKFRKQPFAELPFAVPTSSVSGSTAGLLGIDGWPYERFERRVRYELTSLESALALARSGRCVVFAPDFLVEKHNDSFDRAFALSEIAPPPKMPKVAHEVYAIMHKENDHRSNFEPFLKVLKEAIQTK